MEPPAVRRQRNQCFNIGERNKLMFNICTCNFPRGFFFIYNQVSWWRGRMRQEVPRQCGFNGWYDTNSVSTNPHYSGQNPPCKIS